jgi:tetratricopeptide (TPR) repeat protein
MFPPNAAPELATIHNHLGVLYASAGQTDTALHHFRAAIRYQESMQDRFGAGQTRYNAAFALIRVGRFEDARDWAQSALRDYQACGNADEEVVKTLQLLAQIESGLRASAPPS